MNYEKCILHIDSPKPGSTVPNTCNVSGWFGSNLKITRVQVSTEQSNVIPVPYQRDDISRKLGKHFLYMKGFSCSLSLEGSDGEMSPYFDISLFDENDLKVIGKRVFVNIHPLQLEDDVKSKIVVLHIPKTAGTTLSSIIESMYVENDICKIYEKDKNWCMSFDEFQSLTLKEKSCFKVIIGHVNFGIHSYFQSPIKYITILRKPAERIASLYSHILRDKNHSFHELVKANCRSVGEFAVSDITKQLDNHQVRMISGLNPPIGGVDENALKLAINNIDKYFEMVGLTERFPETMSLLKAALGWMEGNYKSQNVSPRKKQPLSDLETKRILEINKYDDQLYKYAESLFDKKIEELKKAK